MRWASFDRGRGLEFGISADLQGGFVPWELIQKEFKQDKLISSIQNFDDFIPHSRRLESLVGDFLRCHSDLAIEVQDEEFRLPFRPKQFRDFYAFEEHVKRGRKSRGLEMIPTWYEFPVFYYSNHLSFLGPNDELSYPEGCEALDFELEIACVLRDPLFNATLEEARESIMGYCLLNDWSARDVQKKEMPMNMGPTKGKDFATHFGPYVVAARALETLRKEKAYDIEFEVHWNSERIARANWSSIHYSFEEMLVRASQNCHLYPGEVIATGTMGGGCLMEWNLEREPQKWLRPGDQVDLLWCGGPKLSTKISEGSSS